MVSVAVVAAGAVGAAAASSSSGANPDAHIDRNSAIALSIILFLLLVAIAWYLRLHFAQKQQADPERQPQACRAQLDSTTGRVPWDRQCISCGKDTGRGRAGSLFKLKSGLTRKDSVATSSSTGSPGHEPTNGDVEKRKWPGLYQWRTQDSRSSTLGPNAFAIHENTLPLTSTERPSPTLARRESHKSFFDPLPLHNPLYNTPARRRSSSLSQDTYDKRWWNEVARRGSTTSQTRRSSALIAVPEPQVRHHGNTRATGGSSTLSRDQARGSTGSAHASWRGSRCESALYDWTRPRDAQVHAGSEMNFGGVIWDGPRNKDASKACDDENIQSMDWALGV